MPIPTWLAEHIETTTGLPPGGRYARWQKCRTCGRTVLRGLDDDVCALHVVVDPQPLSPLGEAMAKVGGRQTYDLTLTGGRPKLWRRNRHHIRSRPAGSVDPTWRADVVGEHQCHQSIPGSFTAASVHPSKKRRGEGNDQNPPF